MKASVVSDDGLHYQTVQNVQQWAIDRNFLEGATVTGQCMKLLEELGELVANVNRGKCCKDDLGDMLVVLCVLSLLNGQGRTYPRFAEEPRKWHAHESKNVVAARIGEIANRCGVLLHASTQLLEPEDGVQYLYEIGMRVRQLAAALGYSAQGCLAYSYEQIKDRRGKMIDGRFVKEADLPPEV